MDTSIKCEPIERDMEIPIDDLTDSSDDNSVDLIDVEINYSLDGVFNNLPDIDINSSIGDDEFKWEEGEFTPIVHQFDESKSGCKINVNSESKEMDYFKFFFDDEIVSYTVEQTNSQYSDLIKNNNELSYRLQSWYNIDNDEFYLFLAILMLMPLNKRNSVENYWSTQPLYHSPIYSDTMPRNRFSNILRMLNFNNGEERDHLYKIKPFVDMFRKRIMGNFYPYQKICVDESHILMNGQLLYKKYSSSKSNRGMKFFVMCDCKTGYIVDFIIYTGVNNIDYNTSNLGISGEVVMSLIFPYLDVGHTLYVDNSYTSPKLFHVLHKRKTNAVGHVKKNRAGMPKYTKQLETGELKSFHMKEMIVIYWKDNRDVNMLSTIHKPEFSSTGKKNKTGEDIKKLVVFQDFNKNMGSGDRSEMMLSFTSCIRKSLKWYKKLFMHVVDMALFNAHALFIEKTGTRPGLEEFILKTCEQLINMHKKKQPLKRRIINLPSRLNCNSHFVGLLSKDGKDQRKNCVVCTKGKVKKKKKTKFYCKQCNIAMCAVPCHEIYHTKLDF